MNSIPLELFHEICSRLPTKSIGRCRCVSKLWRSILCSADFAKLFLTKSSARPSLLFAMKGATKNEFLFFTSPQLHSQKEKSSLEAYCKLKLPKDMKLEFCSHASGFFCFRHEKISKNKESNTHVIYNPRTGQSVFLPKLGTGSYKSFLGFDPIDKVFKVLVSFNASIHNVLTVGTGEMRWRRIQCSLAFSTSPWSEGICINGVLYYLARGILDRASYVVCFDVRSENFKFIPKGFSNVCGTRLVNYKGNLGVITWAPDRNSREYWGFNTGENSPAMHKLRIWVLEDVVKHDWSEYAYTLDDKFGDTHNVGVVGVTATGKIVFSKEYSHFGSGPFYVIYFHPERNTIQRVKIQGFEKSNVLIISKVYTFANHVDDLTLNMKPHRVQQHRLTFDVNYQLLQQDVHRFEKINKFAALSLLDDV